MIYQLEVTTRCNFSCSYCSGRSMEQKDMSWDTFKTIVDNIKLPSHIVLQGEGEPTLHPKYWDMVDYVCKKGHTPKSTFNGTILDTELIPLYFSKYTIGISVDTLDGVLSNRIGRINLQKVLNNITNLKAVFPARSIVIRTVDFGQDLTEIRKFVKANGFSWHVQPIQTKKDYADTYSSNFINIIPNTSTRTKLCSYLVNNKLRYYTVDGLELPCCFIKNTTGITTIENMKTTMPAACVGCDK